MLDDPHHKLLQDVPDGVIVAEVTLDKTAFDRQLQLAHSAYTGLGRWFHTFVGLQSVAADAQSAKYDWFLVWEDDKAGKSDFWIHSASKEELYQFALEKTKDLDPKSTEIIRLTQPEGVVTPPLVIWDMLLKPEDMPKGRMITLLGDAAHPMTPFRGEGGCHALIDALKLGKVIGELGKRKERGQLAEAVHEYEEEMVKRGGEAAVESRSANEQESGERMVCGQRVRVAGEE